MPIEVKHNASAASIGNAAFIGGMGAFKERQAARQQQASQFAQSLRANERQQERSQEFQGEQARLAREAGQQAADADFQRKLKMEGFEAELTGKRDQAQFDRQLTRDDELLKNQLIRDKQAQEAKQKEAAAKAKNDALLKQNQKFDDVILGKYGNQMRAELRNLQKAEDGINQMFEYQPQQRMAFAAQIEQRKQALLGKVPDAPSEMDILHGKLGSTKNPETGEWQFPENVVGAGAGQIEYKNGLVSEYEIDDKGVFKTKGTKPNPKVEMEAKQAEADQKREAEATKAEWGNYNMEVDNRAQLIRRNIELESQKRKFIADMTKPDADGKSRMTAAEAKAEAAAFGDPEQVPPPPPRPQARGQSRPMGPTEAELTKTPYTPEQAMREGADKGAQAANSGMQRNEALGYAERDVVNLIIGQRDGSIPILKIKSEAELERFPSGASFIAPNGKLKVMP